MTPDELAEDRADVKAANEALKRNEFVSWMSDSFAFLACTEENIYTIDDGEPICLEEGAE